MVLNSHSFDVERADALHEQPAATVVATAGGSDGYEARRPAHLARTGPLMKLTAQSPQAHSSFVAGWVGACWPDVGSILATLCTLAEWQAGHSSLAVLKSSACAIPPPDHIVRKSRVVIQEKTS